MIDDRDRTSARPRFDLAVADASWSWTERLFSPLAELGVRVLLLKACDWRTASVQRRPWRDWLWPGRRLGPSLWERTFVLPPGWMKTYPSLGMRPLARAIRRWHSSLIDPAPLALAISYPHYLHLRDQLNPESLLYYNMDDYALYWRGSADRIRALEQEAVCEADLSVFCAQSRARELAASVPDASGRIVHLPHGAPAEWIPTKPAHQPAEPPDDLAELPGPRLGFIGSLEDRVDWSLLGEVAAALPRASVVLIGREPLPDPTARWYREFVTTASLPNVHLLGWRPQSALPRYAAAFDLCLIPYRTEHPFNQAACPTKVMDYMATSRPVVSTDLPECRLYNHVFSVATDREAFVIAVREILARGGDDGLALDRWSLARESTWTRMATRLLGQFQERLSLRA